MAYDGRLLRLAQERYEADRTRREAELAAQREEIYARRPRLREIQEQLRRTASRVMAAALRRGQDPLPEIARLREENLGLQAERRQLLSELGLPGGRAGGHPGLPAVRRHRVPGRRAVPLPEDLLCGGAAPGAFPSAGFGRAEL